MSNNEGLSNAVLYNPRQLNPEAMKAVFTARRPLLDRLLQDLHAPRPSHQLIVGARGMGKTSLLRRLGIAIEEDPELAKRLVPVTFPEEQYNVGSLGEFYLNCLDALADYLDKHNDAKGARSVDRIVAQLRNRPEIELVEESEAALVSRANSMGRQLVLLVDNLSIVVERLSEKEKWRLREWLSSSEQRPVLVAATVKFISDTTNYGQALYEFLHVHELPGCDTEEAMNVMVELSKVFNAPQVAIWLKNDPARIAVLNRLAGGAPRTLVMLFQLLVQGVEGPIFQELERLLDLATPLYKSRFEELPEQAQRVVDMLALRWDPATRRDLEESSRMDGNAISSQLSRLVKMGVVEELTLPGAAKTAYQIAERFFNIWYLMRASRRSRHQLRWLVEFLKAFYDVSERNNLAQRLLHIEAGEHVSHGRRLLALSQTIEDKNLQRELQNSAMYAFAKANREHRADIDLSDVDKDWLARLEHLHVTAEREGFILRAIQESPDNAYHYTKLGQLYEEETHQYLKAAEAYRESLRHDPNNAYVWDDLGTVLTDQLDRHAEAEDVLRKGIQVDAQNAWPWLHLGKVLANHFGRYDEAERAYREAARLLPSSAWTWIRLGDFLTIHLQRDSEAEQAFRKAIEVDRENKWGWLCLGDLLLKLGRFDESEQAYRNGIKADPDYTWTWIHLGDLLLLRPERDAEAEKVYRKAAEIEHSTSAGKARLAWFLYQRGAAVEAESLARQVCDFDPKPVNWHRLACILASQSKISESLEWMRKTMESVPDVLSETQLSDLVIYFHELVRLGHADLGVRLLEEMDREEAWRPLVEALRAAGQRNRGTLLRINPEQRESAEKIYDLLLEGMPEEAATVRKTSRKGKPR